MRLSSLILLYYVNGYDVELLPAANENLRIFALPMGLGEATIIQCPIDANGNGGELSVYDLGSLITYYEWWDVAKLLKQGQKIRYMFLSHPDDTHTNVFPKVFPINQAETEEYPDLSDLQAIYHVCPSDQYVVGLPQHLDTSVQEWLDYNNDKTIMINEGKPCGTMSCLEDGNDYKTCTCPDDRKIVLCPSNPEIKMEFIAANLNSCERDRFGLLASNTDSLVARVSYNDFSMLLMGDNMSPIQEEVLSFYNDIDENYFKSTVLKCSEHGNTMGTTEQLVSVAQPAIAFYSSAHLNQDWSSGDCKTFLRLVNNVDENGEHTLRRIPEGQDQYVQDEINCYDSWGPDLPDDQPVRTYLNTERVAYYSTTFGAKFKHDDLHSNGLYTWPCNINRLDIETDGTENGTNLTPVRQGEMPFPPCMKPDFWT